MREQACQRALTRKRTLWGGSALEVGDLRLVEDGSQRSGALGSDVVDSETASEGQDGNSERVGVSMGADTKANTRAGGALERGHRASLERLAQLGDTLGDVGASPDVGEAAELVVGQTAKGRR